MDAVFTQKYEALPRPANWMPGPPAPWSTTPPDMREITAGALQEFLQGQRERREQLAELTRHPEDTPRHPEDTPRHPELVEGSLPEEAIEDLGDNDISTKPAAVLVPCILGVEGKVESLIFMTRTMSVSHHKGQVSFPGGMIESGETELQAALRETREETGIPEHAFTVIGQSTPVATRTKRGHITPVVATCSRKVMDNILISEAEVEVLHTISWDQLVAPDNYFSEIWDFNNQSVTIHMFFVYDTNNTPVFIWGATAHILVDVLHCLNT